MAPTGEVRLDIGYHGVTGLSYTASSVSGKERRHDGVVYHEGVWAMKDETDAEHKERCIRDRLNNVQDLTVRKSGVRHSSTLGLWLECYTSQLQPVSWLGSDFRLLDCVRTVDDRNFKLG